MQPLGSSAARQSSPAAAAAARDGRSTSRVCAFCKAVPVPAAAATVAGASRLPVARRRSSPELSRPLMVSAGGLRTASHCRAEGYSGRHEDRPGCGALPDRSGTLARAISALRHTLRDLRNDHARAKCHAASRKHAPMGELLRAVTAGSCSVRGGGFTRTSCPPSHAGSTSRSHRIARTSRTITLRGSCHSRRCSRATWPR